MSVSRVVSISVPYDVAVTLAKILGDAISPGCTAEQPDFPAVSHALFALSADGLGEIRIFVPEGRLEEAKEILAEHRRQGMEIVDGDDGGDGPRGADGDDPR